MIKKYNSIKYEKEIEAYNDKIEEEANEINSLNLNHVQVFMNVIDNMWQNIKGYSEPDKDISGFLELDLATEEGYGICRNMASDVAKKLNKVNPEYNAIAVRVLTEKYEINFNNSIKDNIENLADNFAGNHKVVLATIPEDNLVVAIDPTWKTLGVCENGNIKIFYSNKEEKIFNIKEIYSILDFKSCNGYEVLIEGSQHYIKSFTQPNLTPEQIKDKYGKQAQQIALKEVREIINNQKKEQKQNSNKRDEFLAKVKTENYITAGISQDLSSILNNTDKQKEDKNTKNDKDYIK